MKKSELRQLIREQIEAEFGPKNEIFGFGKSKSEEQPANDVFNAKTTEQAYDFFESILGPLRDDDDGPLRGLTSHGSKQEGSVLFPGTLEKFIERKASRIQLFSDDEVKIDPSSKEYAIALGLLIASQRPGKGNQGLYMNIESILGDEYPGITHTRIVSSDKNPSMEELEDLARLRYRVAKGGRLRLGGLKDPDKEHPLPPLYMKIKGGGPYTRVIGRKGGETFVTDSLIKRYREEIMSRLEKSDVGATLMANQKDKLKRYAELEAGGSNFRDDKYEVANDIVYQWAKKYMDYAERNYDSRISGGRFNPDREATNIIQNFKKANTGIIFDDYAVKRRLA